MAERIEIWIDCTLAHLEGGKAAYVDHRAHINIQYTVPRGDSVYIGMFMVVLCINTLPRKINVLSSSKFIFKDAGVEEIVSTPLVFKRVARMFRSKGKHPFSKMIGRYMLIRINKNKDSCILIFWAATLKAPRNSS